jgi:OmpA-OmpF porin, OOP family
MKHISSIAIVAALMAAPASAQFYIGGNVGASDVKANNTAPADQFLDLGFDSAVNTNDKRDVGYRLFGGYQLHKYVAVEAAYVDLGKFGFRTDVVPTGALSGAMNISGFEVAAVGTLPINERFGLFARVGAFSNETKTSYNGTGSVEVITGAETQRKRSTRLSYGAGVMFAINKNFSLRGEWSRYAKLGSAFTGGKTDANLYSLGVVFRF